MATATIPTTSQAGTTRPLSPALRSCPSRFIAAPALIGASGFAMGILCAHFIWFVPGWALVGVLALFPITAVACRISSHLVWLSTGLVYVLLGILCGEIAPVVNPQKQLALLADNSPRTLEGEVVRLGPVRKVLSTTPFSTKTHEEHSQRIDVRLDSLADSAVRVTLFAPVEEVFPQITCGDRARATLAMHSEERYLDPGVWDAGGYLLRQGIGALASAKAEKFAVIAVGRRSTLACRLHSLQLSASSRLIDYADRASTGLMPDFLRVGHDDAAMLTAMLTGDRNYLQRSVR